MDDVTARIRAVRFTPVRLREGYDQGQVDVFLDRLVEAVEEDGDLDPLILAARFATTSMREGYDMGEVDAFLDTLTQQVHPPAVSSYAAPPAPRGRAGSRRSDDAVVQEVPGLFARLFGRR